MTKAEQKELQEIYAILSFKPILSAQQNADVLERLKALSEKERHPEGSDHLLTGKSWQELEVMERWAKIEVNSSKAGLGFGVAYHLIISEMQRRLLALIAKNQD